MTKALLTILISTALLTSCSTLNKRFGQVVIEGHENTAETKQEILKIKNIDKDIFDTATFKSAHRGEIRYRLFSPERQKTNTKIPLVVVYHGSGGIGVDNASQLGLLQKLFASPDIQRKYPAYVLAPQFSTRSSDYALDTARQLLCSAPRPCLEAVFQLIDSLQLSLNFDQERIYAVGFSMGGSTVINSLSARPDLFAAGISIAGIPQFDHMEAMQSIPIWLIHGTDDTENPIHSDEQLYKERPGNMRFWKFKGRMHDDIVTKQILGEALPRWLFSHRKGQK